MRIRRSNLHFSLGTCSQPSLHGSRDMSHFETRGNFHCSSAQLCLVTISLSTPTRQVAYDRWCLFRRRLGASPQFHTIYSPPSTARKRVCGSKDCQQRCLRKLPELVAFCSWRRLNCQMCKIKILSARNACLYAS